jgi:hypothetical protein
MFALTCISDEREKGRLSAQVVVLVGASKIHGNGWYLCEEVAADDSGLKLGMLLVGGNDGTSPCNLSSQEFRVKALRRARGTNRKDEPRCTCATGKVQRRQGARKQAERGGMCITRPGQKREDHATT